jgi:hypothetical protein
MAAGSEYNVTFKPQQDMKVSFQKIFLVEGADGNTGGNILNDLHSFQIPGAGLSITRRVASNPTPAVVTGAGFRATLTFLTASRSTVAVVVEHFDDTKSPIDLATALLGHVSDNNGQVVTEVVQAEVSAVVYV